MTIEQIKADENFLSSLELPDYNFGVYLIFTGLDKPKYYVYYKGELLFQGNDFRPSPLYGVDSLETICSLCTFITVKPGDVDSDYFKDYTSKQLDFANTFDCEAISGLISDYANGGHDIEDNEYRLRALAELQKAFTA